MTLHADCARERDVIDALTTEQWPDRCEPELRAHVEGCDGCRDLVAVFAPLGRAWAEARADARLPASGTVWWRAQVRARQDAARAAARPVAVAHAVAALLGTGIVAGVLFLIAPWLSAALAASRLAAAVDLTGLTIPAGWIVAAAGALVAVATLAVYLVVAED